jgi:hypothetical protein
VAAMGLGNASDMAYRPAAVHQPQLLAICGCVVPSGLHWETVVPEKMKKKKKKGDPKKGAWKAFSEYVRRSYADRNGNAFCYTCEQPAHWKELQCGHGIGGRHNAVLLDSDICRPQCLPCNIFRRGNYPVFVTKLIKEHSASWFEKKLADARKAVKMNRSDWESACEYWRAKLQTLEGA